MALSISFVAFLDEPSLVGSEIQKSLQFICPQLSVYSECSQKDNTISFRVDSTDVIIGIMPAPIPWSDLEGPCATSLLWPDAAQLLKKHKIHAIVTANGDLDPIPLSTILTQATAAVMASSPLAIGVFWGNSALVIPKELFIAFATEVLPKSLPLDIWIDFRVGKADEKSSSGFTTGLEALGHMEFETIHAPETPSQLRERLFNLAAYVLDNGPVIKDGNTVGKDSAEHIKVKYGTSLFGNPNMVIRLEYEQLIENKPWWKLW